LRVAASSKARNSSQLIGPIGPDLISGART
jgi:hypothetical protein